MQMKKERKDTKEGKKKRSHKKKERRKEGRKKGRKEESKGKKKERKQRKEGKKKRRKQRKEGRKYRYIEAFYCRYNTFLRTYMMKVTYIILKLIPNVQQCPSTLRNIIQGLWMQSKMFSIDIKSSE